MGIVVPPEATAKVESTPPGDEQPAGDPAKEDEGKATNEAGEEVDTEQAEPEPTTFIKLTKQPSGKSLFVKAWRPTAEGYSDRAVRVDAVDLSKLNLAWGRKRKAPSWKSKKKVWTLAGRTMYGDKYKVFFAVGRGKQSVQQALEDARRKLGAAGAARDEIRLVDFYVDKRKRVYVLAGGRPPIVAIAK